MKISALSRNKFIMYFLIKAGPESKVVKLKLCYFDLHWKLFSL